jgi:hypothetical protein
VTEPTPIQITASPEFREALGVAVDYLYLELDATQEYLSQLGEDEIGSVQEASAITESERIEAAIDQLESVLLQGIPTEHRGWYYCQAEGVNTTNHRVAVAHELYYQVGLDRALSRVLRDMGDIERAEHIGHIIAFLTPEAQVIDGPSLRDDVANALRAYYSFVSSLNTPIL